MDISKPAVPAGAGPTGSALWSSVVDEYELEDHELALLRSMVFLVDVIEQLRAVLLVEGVMADGKVNPAAVELRQATITLARTSAALRLPAGDDGEGDRRPQRRVGVRGTYGLRAVS